MKPGDLYMHSDYGGAASTIIKSPPDNKVPPRMTLEEGAIFTVCRSKAWDTKIISSAWWVYHDQVSKSAPTGEFLPTGSFMIRGKRNFVHPNRMEMGFTLLYRLDNESMHSRIEKQRAMMQQRETEDILESREAMKDDEEFAIIDLEAEARKAREEVSSVIGRKSRSCRKEGTRASKEQYLSSCKSRVQPRKGKRTPMRKKTVRTLKRRGKRPRSRAKKITTRTVKRQISNNMTNSRSKSTKIGTRRR